MGGRLRLRKHSTWQWRPGDPVYLSVDSQFGLTLFKNVLDHGWFGSSPDLGAPFRQDASWFPHADHLHLFLWGKAIGVLWDNPFTVSAIYFFSASPWLLCRCTGWLASSTSADSDRWSQASFLSSAWPPDDVPAPHACLVLGRAPGYVAGNAPPWASRCSESGLTGGNTANGGSVSISALDGKSVFDKLIDLRASVADPNVRLGVVQQHLE